MTDDIENAMRSLLVLVGEDPSREGLIDTPKRFIKAMSDMTIGYGQDPSQILSMSFSEDYDDILTMSPIRFVSLCEHHLLPFSGWASIAYHPRNGVVGLSKLVRVVDCFSKRLQVQERLTTQIAESIQEHLDPVGVGVMVSATHLCMQGRGVSSDAVTTTSVVIGNLDKNYLAEVHRSHLS